MLRSVALHVQSVAHGVTPGLDRETRCAPALRVRIVNWPALMPLVS